MVNVTEAPEPATGTPGPATLRRAALQIVDAGRRKDPATTDRVVTELHPPAILDLDDLLLGHRVLLDLIGALAAVAGDLLRDRHPRGALAREMVAISRGR